MKPGWIPRITLVALLSLLLPGCSDNESPAPAVCEVDVEVLDFGSRLPPLDDHDVTLELDLTVSNQPLRYSSAGNEDLVGEVSIHFDAQAADPPDIHLNPPQVDPTFRLGPKKSARFSIAAVVTRETSPGLYTGEIDLGTGCDPVPFRLDVVARSEPQPVFVLSWGSKGPERGQLNKPQGIAVDRGFVYVTDQGNSRVQRFSDTGDFRGEWVRWQEPDADSMDTGFYLVAGVAVDAEGRVYVTDTEPEFNRDRVSVFDTNGNWLKRWGPLRLGGSIFDRPWHLDVDAAGLVYVVDQNNDRVLKFRLKDSGAGYETLTEWGRFGTGPGQFRNAWGLAVGDGFVYVSDWSNHKVQKFTSSGGFVLQWGGEGQGAGQFNHPVGLEVDPDGDVYVADQGNQRVQKFSENGAFLNSWGTGGSGPGEFDQPLDVAVDGNGFIYVLDSANNRVQKFRPGDAP